MLTHLRDTLLLVAVVGALATLLLGACGGESSPSLTPTPTPEPSATTVATTTPRPTTTTGATATPEPSATTVATTTPEPSATPVPTVAPTATPATRPSEAATSDPTPTSTPETTVAAEEARGVIVVDPDVQACSNGVVVPEPELNPGLVDDCAALLTAREILIGNYDRSDNKPLIDWRVDVAVSEWDGEWLARPREGAGGQDRLWRPGAAHRNDSTRARAVIEAGGARLGRRPLAQRPGPGRTGAAFGPEVPEPEQ